MTQRPDGLNASRQIPDELLEHYVGTRVVATDGRVLSDAAGGAVPMAEELWVLTAWNPWSTETDTAVNDAAHERLRHELLAEGWQPVACDGHAPDLSWTEPAWAVAGAARARICELARAHEQYGVFHLTATEHQVIECATERIRATRPR